MDSSSSSLRGRKQIDPPPRILFSESIGNSFCHGSCCLKAARREGIRMVPSHLSLAQPVTLRVGRRQVLFIHGACGGDKGTPTKGPIKPVIAVEASCAPKEVLCFISDFLWPRSGTGPYPLFGAERK